jgi:hypothetical protein
VSTSQTQLDLARAYLRVIGRTGGLSTSPAKVAAVRINGRKGGRPRKAGRPAPTVEPEPDTDDHDPINSEGADAITVW